MITRFYVDNYKCLVNFEYSPQAFELILGSNGAGKTTVFSVLQSLRDFVVKGLPVEECFPPSTLTRWQTRDVQAFQIECFVPMIDAPHLQEQLIYELKIKHDRVKKLAHVQSECLLGGSGVLFDFVDGNARLFRDNYSDGPTFPTDWTRSALGNVPERHDNRRLTAFRHLLRDSLLVHLNPMQMDYASEKESSELAPDMKNFASWYRHHSQEDPEKISQLNEDLRFVLEDFSTMQLQKTGSERRELFFKTKGGKDAKTFRFDELSDGQRALIALYSVAHFAVAQGETVCLDEPENFVALRELEPILETLREKQEESQGQVLLISHHPEFINRVVEQSAVVFERENGAHTRARPFSFNGVEAISPAELVARGWESDAKR